jgi:hypothetical protein
MCRGGQHHGLLGAVGLLDVQLVRAKRSSLRGLLVSSTGVLRGWFDYSIFPGQQGVVMRAAAASLIVTFVILAWRYQRPHITGYKEIASRIVKNYDSGIILFDGSVPGNFVFFVRTLDPGRRFVTLRKMLYADDIRPGLDSEESLHSKEEVVAALGRYGVRFAGGVTEPGDPLRLPTHSGGTAARR